MGSFIFADKASEKAASTAPVEKKVYDLTLSIRGKEGALKPSFILSDEGLKKLGIDATMGVYMGRDTDTNTSFLFKVPVGKAAAMGVRKPKEGAAPKDESRRNSFSYPKFVALLTEAGDVPADVKPKDKFYFNLEDAGSIDQVSSDPDVQKALTERLEVQGSFKVIPAGRNEVKSETKVAEESSETSQESQNSEGTEQTEATTTPAKTGKAKTVVPQEETAGF